MDPWLLAKAFAIGLAVAAPVGPMAMLCISYTLTRGRPAGLAFGAGIAAADGTYAAVAAFGITALTSVLITASLWVKLIGSLVLIYLGVKIAMRRPSTTTSDAAGGPRFKLFTTAYALTLANPPTILFFASLFASVSALVSFTESVLFSAGVLVGSLAWWIVLTTLVARTAARLTPPLVVWINRCSALTLLAFAGYGLLSAWRGS